MRFKYLVHGGVSMLVLGIDPGLAILGYGIVERACYAQ